MLTGAELLAGVPAAVRPPTRVLFIIYGLTPAGPELRLVEFARHFPASTEVHICVIGDDLTLLDELRKTRAKVAIIPVRRPYTEWRQVRKILAYIRAHDIHIINSFDLKTLLVALVAKLRYGRRLKLVHHLISLWDDVREHHKKFLWRALRYADMIVCNGYAVREGLIGSRRLKAPVVVVPNGVDCDHFRPLPEVRRTERARLGFTPEHFVLGTVANIRPVKNYPLLLHTTRRVAENYPHVRLVCVGGGPQLEEMRELTHQLGLRDKVVFSGQVTDIRPWVATFDAFALCSFKEGCPNALMQAMAMNIASMSSNVGEVPHLTDRGTCALLFEPTDGETFFAAARRLVGDPEYRTRLAASGRRRMEEHYANEKMIDAYVALFDSAAQELQLR